MTTHTDSINLHIRFSTDPDFLADWAIFSRSDVLENFAKSITLEHYVNGKHLACPMPLLKLKMALKTAPLGNGVYVTATDPNSIHDIGAFCRHLGYEYVSFTTQNDPKVFHILVQKTV